MSYQIGIDLGTTYTAAAIYREERVQIFPLGGRAAAIPSVVLLREDETVLTGEAAVRRAITEPERVAREFKRRLGDTTPIIVGGTPYSAEALSARLLRSVLDEVAAREGGPPDRIAVSHPANWGSYKHDLLRQAFSLAGLAADDIVLMSEPEAAAISYASQERVDPGEIVAVYDLGGGTFDAAVLRRTEAGFEIIGKPEGIERLGGIDFDAAMLAHVNRALDGALEDLDEDDPAVTSAVARLRQDCVDAKEALSSDTDATIPVLLPGLQTDVRITRSEFEGLIRPSLVDSIEALRRAVRSAGVEPDDVSRVLLVGGSSRVPLIAQMVSSELGRPIAVDAHPKHAIALGAAIAAANSANGVGVAVPPVVPVAETPPPTVVETPPPAAGEPPPPAAASTVTPPDAAPATPAADAGASPDPTPAPAAPDPTPAPVAAESVPAPAPAPASAPEPAPVPTAADPVPVAQEAPGSASSGVAGANRTPMLIAAGVVGLLVVGILAFVLTRGNGDTVAAGGTSSTVTGTEDEGSEASDSTTTSSTEAVTTTLPDDTQITASVRQALGVDGGDVEVSVNGGVVTLNGVAADETARAGFVSAASSVEGVSSVVDGLEVLPEEQRCATEIQSQPRWACIDSVTFDGTTLSANFAFENSGTPFSTSSGFHLHFFDGDANEPVTAGASGDASTGGGDWQIWDQTPGYETQKFAGTEIAKLCVRVATPSHTLESLDSGNCWPVERL